MIRTITTLVFTTFLLLTTSAQDYVLSLSGFVYDEATGTGISGHVVIAEVIGDGMVTTLDLTTNDGGYYGDSIPVTSPGWVLVYTYDCLGMTISDTGYFSPEASEVTLDFYICADTIPQGCNALYTYMLPPNGWNTVTFSNQSTGSPASWQWEFGDGTTSTEWEPVHTFGDAGIYPVCLTIWGDSSCYDVYCKDIVIGGPGGECSNWFSFTSPDGLTFDFSGDAMPEASDYIWDFGDGSTSYGQDVQHIYDPSLSGPVPVSLTTIHWTPGTADTCVAFSTQVVMVGDSAYGCENFFWYILVGDLTLQFNGESFPVPVDAYIWDFGDGQTGWGQQVDHTFDPDLGEPFTVTLTTYSTSPDGDTCVATSSQEVWITNGGGEDCSNIFWYESMDLVTFDFFGESFPYPADQFIWDFGDGTVATGPEASHTYEGDPGSVFTVTLTTLSSDPVTGDSCVYVSAQEIYIGGNGGDCTNLFWYEAGEGDTYTFTGESDPPAVYYSWDFGDGSTATGQNVTHTFDQDQGPLFVVCLTTFASNYPADSCVAISCQEVFLGETGGSTVTGSVYAGDEPADLVVVGLFGTGTDNVFYQFTLTETGTGMYSFENIPGGDYYIFANPTPQSSVSYDYFPTYFGDAVFWFEAQLVSIEGASGPYDISLVPIQESSSGPCDIEGVVTVEGGKAINAGNITIMLMGADDQPLDYTLTSETGSFSFADLAFGTYKLKVEMPGVNSETALVVLSEESQSADLHFYMNNTTAYLGIGESLSSVSMISNIYPNPVQDAARLNVTVADKTELNVQVISHTGQVVSSYRLSLDPGEQVIEIGTSSLSPGLYQVRFMDEYGNAVVRKFIR